MASVHAPPGIVASPPLGRSRTRLIIANFHIWGSNRCRYHPPGRSRALRSTVHDTKSGGRCARRQRLSCKCRRHVADMSATCDTVAGFRRHGAVTATQNQLTVPTPYVGISMYVGRYTFSDDIFAKCVDMSRHSTFQG